MKLKREYEMTFKEGFRLGVRLTRAKAYIENARDAKRLDDDAMAKLFMEFAQDWGELARNAGRKFTPSAAHDPEQSAFDFGTYNNSIEKLKYIFIDIGDRLF